MIHKTIAQRWGRKGERGIASMLTLLSLMLILVPLAGCSPQGVAQSATATASSQATQAASSAPTVAPSTLPTTPTAVSVQVTSTEGILVTPVPTPEGTEGPRPTPTGTAPDPLSLLNIFQFYSGDFNLVSRDVVNLDGTGPDEVLFTAAGIRHVITDEVRSGIAVLSYDPVYREWSPLWASEPISGTASPLPSTNRKEAGGYNAGNILGNIGPVLVARTTTVDGKAHLYLWRWNNDKKVGERLKMASAAGAPDTDAVFDADLDVNVADLDDDGIYEVVVDNLASVQVWRWDGTHFAPGGNR